MNAHLSVKYIQYYIVCLHKKEFIESGIGLMFKHELLTFLVEK